MSENTIPPVGQQRLVRLRLAYNGDYPGYATAWINDRPVVDQAEAMLLRMMGVERGGIRGLMDQLGAEKTDCGLERREWLGEITLTIRRTNQPNSQDLPPSVGSGEGSNDAAKPASP